MNDYAFIKREYTSEEIAYIKENYMAMTDAEIGEHIGRSDTAVAVFRCKMGWERKFRFHENDDNLIRRWYKVKSNAELAEMIGCEPRQVAKRKHLLKLRTKRMTSI